MRFIYLVVILAFAFFFVTFAFENPYNVPLKYYGYFSTEVPLYIIVFGFFSGHCRGHCRCCRGHHLRTGSLALSHLDGVLFGLLLVVKLDVLVVVPFFGVVLRLFFDFGFMTTRMRVIASSAATFLAITATQGLFVPFTEREHTRLHADERRISRVFLEHRGEPRAHRHFGALADVAEQVFLDRDVRDLFVVKRPADKA